MLRVVSLFVIIGLALAKNEIYDGAALYEISVKNTDQIELVNYLSITLNADILTHALPGRPGQIVVPKDKRTLFQNELTAVGVEFKLQADNIKELLDLEEQLLSEASKRSNGTSRLNSLPFDQIYTYHQFYVRITVDDVVLKQVNDIVHLGYALSRDDRYTIATERRVDVFLGQLAEAYPETVTLVNAGKSFEGRDIKYVRISTTNFEDTSKPIVFMESLLHAREWITLPATLYAIHKLVIDITEQDLVQDIDWIILPIANPDGYVHTHVESRLWRKNRNTDFGLICSGVDLNRNFDIHWSEASSNVVCMETFHGSGPFSESETQVTRDIFARYGNRIQLFLDIHSFGSMILYGYGNGVLPSNGLLLHMVAIRMASAIDSVKMSWNPDYIVGNVALVLYDASGSAGDYAQSVGVPYSYTYELPGHRFGVGGLGFLVDPAFIEQAGFETWEGIKEGARYVRDNYRR